MDQEVLQFDKTAFDCCKLITKNYEEKAFYLCVWFVPAKCRDAFYTIYAFLRYTDETVDTFWHADRKMLLKKFQADTFAAIESKLSFNPVLHAYQLVVHRYKLDLEMTKAVFRSMEMDLDVKTQYEKSDYETYIYGVSEVIGLMCLRVVCDGREELYNELAKPMQKLSSALQKINFLRDIKKDFEDRGRFYFPGMKYADFDETSKKKIEADIEADFDESYSGIVRLPDRIRFSAEITYIVYRKWLDRIKNTSAESLLRDGRVDHSNWFLIYSTKFLYLWINILLLLSVGIYALCFTPQYFYKFKEIVGTMVFSAPLSIYCDQWFTRTKVCSLNQKYVTGLKLYGSPIEKCLFFVSAPFAYCYVYEYFKQILTQNAVDHTTAQYSFAFLIVSFLLFGLYNYNRIYTRVISSAAIVTLALHYYLFQFEIFGRVLLALILHNVPFFIVNGVLTDSFLLTEPILFYNKNHICNVKILTIPIEDAIYSFAWLLLCITSFEYY